jgi:hypothetical protein
MARTVLGLLKRIQNRYQATRSFALNYAISKGKYIKPSYVTEKRVQLHKEMNGGNSLKVSDDEIILFWSLGRPVEAHTSVISSTVHHRRRILGLAKISAYRRNISAEQKVRMLESVERLKRTECPDGIISQATSNIESLIVS